MSDRETFGPRLRRERERRRISLETIASVTKVSADLWIGLEQNDFSKWPSGIFARAFVRDYARAVGLDADEVVNEFCRLFPIGDRRANRLLRGHAQLIGHHLAYAEPGPLPAGGDRRAAAQPLSERDARRARVLWRTAAAAIDTLCTLTMAGGFAYLAGTGFWAAAGVLSLVYYGASTVLLAATPGRRAVDTLRQRVPTLLSVLQRRRATA